MDKMISQIPPTYQGRPSHLHVLWTFRFFEEVLGVGSVPERSTEEWLVARDTASYHHNPRSEHREDLWVQTADRISSGHDRRQREEGATGNPRQEHLLSTFPRLNGAELDRVEEWRYPLKPIAYNREALFPSQKDSWGDAQSAYQNLWDGFRKAIESIPIRADYERVITRVYYALKKYCWCVPSDAWTSHPDISLFDHSRITAALTGCLSQSEGREEFLLISGDISGIQSFIHDVQQPESSRPGTAKRLRGRSTWLSLLSDSLAYGLAKRLNLSWPNIIWSGGGHCILVAPATEEAKSTIHRFDRDVQQWLWREQQGRITFNIGTLRVPADELRDDYASCIGRLSREVSARKNRKLDAVVLNPDIDLVLPLPKSETRDVCPICGRDTPKKAVSCEECTTHTELGGKLAHAKWIAMVDESAEADVRFDVVGIGWRFTNRPITNAINFEMTPTADPLADGSKSLAVCLPTDVKGEPLTFEDMATSGDTEEGIERLAAVRIDVDNLGSLFGSLPEREKSISRITSISSQLDLFFTGYLPAFVKDNAATGYITYAGGDDVFLVAEWRDAVNIASGIQSEFSDFVCANPHITISAGIELFPKRFPVAVAGANAGVLLEEAKNTDRDGKTKDACFAFGYAFRWPELEESRAVADGLIGKIRRGLIPRGIPYRLLAHYRSFEVDKNRIRYIGLLRYIVSRNIKDEPTRLGLLEYFGNESMMLRIPALCTYIALNIRERRS